LSPLHIALTYRAAVCLARVGSRTRLDPLQRRTSVEQRQGASRGATNLPMLSLRSSPRFKVYSTYTCRPQDFQLDLSDLVTLSSTGVAGGMLNETM